MDTVGLPGDGPWQRFIIKFRERSDPGRESLPGAEVVLAEISLQVVRSNWVVHAKGYSPCFTRFRIMPSCATLATSSPARLKILPRLKPRPAPLHGLSVA